MSSSGMLRKGTEDTLVGSPVASTCDLKKQWMKPGSYESKPPMSLQDELEEDAMRDVPRRSSTSSALVEDPETNMPVDKLESPEQLRVNEVVTSPISTSVLSATFGLDTPDSTVPSLSSGISTSSIPTSSSPVSLKKQRRIRLFSNKSGKRNGETLESVRGTARLAARAALLLAEASNFPYLKGTASIVLLILEYSDGVVANREDCARMINTASQLLETMETLAVGHNGKLPKALEGQADRLTKTFQEVLRDVKQLSDSRRSYFKKFMLVQRDREIIQRCEYKLQGALSLFGLQSIIEMRTDQIELREELKRRDKEALRSCEYSQREAAASGLRDPDTFKCRSVVLPPCPTTFLGRTEVLGQLVKRVTDNSPSRIAILGPGGIGKSSLVLKLLYHEKVISRYGEDRFFVPCDSSTSVDGLICAISSHVGLPEMQGKGDGQSGQRAAQIVTYLKGRETDSGVAPRAILLVLDNLESPWEPDRTNVEKLLTQIVALDNVSLVITLRGAERPSHVNWSRPLPPPLQVLEPKAARQMFLSISDAPYEPTYKIDSPDDLDELLALCGHLPLAIRLMAELAMPEIDTVPSLLKRWKRTAHSTSMLSMGEDPVHSLEISIELSLGSLRMKRVPEAVILLILLALLPDGIQEDDLQMVAPLLDDREEASLTLIKTSLAYKASNRLKVLAPVRTYVASKHKAKPSYTRALEKHYWNLIDRPENGQRGAGRIQRALPELGNIECLIDRALQEDFEPSLAIAASVNLGQIFLETSLGEPRLKQLQRALELAEQIRNEGLQADCMYTIAVTKHRFFHKREEAATCGDEFLRASELYHKVDDEVGLGRCLQQLASFYHVKRDFEAAKDTAEKAYQVHVKSGCFSGQASALTSIARMLRALNEPQQAVERANEALKFLRTQYHDPISEAQCLQFLGDLQCTAFCDYVHARELLEESFRIYKALMLEETSNCMDTLVSMGELELICSRYEEAKDAFQRAVGIYRKAKRRDYEANALVRLGLAFLGLESPSDASDRIREGLTIWEEIPNKWGIGISCMALGDVAMYEKTFSEAEDHYGKALDYLRADSVHWKTFEAECLLKLGTLYVRTVSGQDDTARELLQIALQLYNGPACRRGRADCTRQLAELDLKGNDEQAKRRALKRLEDTEQEYADMGLHVERQQCAKTIATTYRLLGEKPSKSLQLQIRT